MATKLDGGKKAILNRVKPKGIAKTAGRKLSGMTEKKSIEKQQEQNLTPKEIFTTSFDEKRFVFPEGYGIDAVVLLIKDPLWMHSYWDLSGGRVNELKAQCVSEIIDSSRMVLRVKDVTSKNPDNPNNFYDIDIPYGAKNWYINVPTPNRNYCVELGFITRNGDYILIVRSNTVSIPRDDVSDLVDEEWMSIDYYDKMYALSGGVKTGLSSADLRRLVKHHLEKMAASGGVPSSHILAGRPIKDRSFFLVVNTELIVYGQTVPDAKLTIQGAPTKLNADGTFSIRFNLPDGQQVIPVTSVSSDDIDKITITPVVNKETM